MIKLMKTDNKSLQLLDNEDIVLEIKGHHTILTADNLEELRSVLDHFWSANNLYTQTSEAKADRERHENEWGKQLTPTGLQQASKY